MDKATRKRLLRAEETRKVVRDRRRFKVGTPASGYLGHPVAKETKGTVFRRTVQTAVPGLPVLTDGINQVKLGGDVLVGTLKGYRIMGLTLEERATCPTSCDLWQTCYGNDMPFTTRWRPGKELEAALDQDIRVRLEERPLLVRLHMLGDFYSWRYLCKWADMLDEHDDLAAFGFTAHPPGTKLGDGVAKLRATYPDRFAVRHSGALGRWGSATLDFPTERRFVGDGIVCPEQLDANSDNPRGKHCGNCAACWETDRCVLFVEHGNTKRGRPNE